MANNLKDEEKKPYGGSTGVPQYTVEQMVNDGYKFDRSGKGTDPRDMIQPYKTAEPAGSGNITDLAEPVSPTPVYGSRMVEDYKPTNLAQAADQDGAYAKLTALEEQGRPTYTGRYDEQIQQLLGDIYNRGPFSYNYNEDPLYAQYAESYTQGGRNAMKNTMGNAAALTGGYGNTYAQMAGQQAYNNYMQGLADKIPDLYQLAANRYDQETANLQSKLGTFNNQDNIDYSRFRDTMGDYDTDLAYAYQKWLAAQQQNNYLTELYQQYHKLDPNYNERKEHYLLGYKT